MKINNRILLILFTAVCSLLLALIVISHVFILGTFDEIERSQTGTGMQGVISQLDSEVEDLAAVCRQWARSDDTYAFMKNKDPDYIRSRMAEYESFQDIKVSYILFYNDSGTLVFARGYDPKNGITGTVPSAIDIIVHDSIIPPGFEEGISGRRGFSLLNGEPVILAGYHIFPSDRSGIPRGTLVMARKLDQQAVAALAQQGELDISMRQSDSFGSTSRFNDAEIKRMEQGAVLVIPVNDTVMEGAVCITGIENTPTRILVQVFFARPVHQLVRTSIIAIAVITGILAAILVIVIRWPLKKYIVNPLLRIESFLTETGSSQDISRRVCVDGDDEIRILAESLNQMLEEIRTSHEMIRESEERFRTLIENTPDIVICLDRNGLITYISPQAGQYGSSPNELIGISAFDLIFPEDRENIRECFKRALVEGRGDSTPFRILDRGQNVHWLEVKSTAIRDTAGGHTGLQAVIRDITERRRALDTITLANRKLNLMYDITRHDILNKITILFGLIDMTRASESPADQNLFLGEIRDAGEAIFRQILLTRDYQEVGVKSPRWTGLKDVAGRALTGFAGTGIQYITDIGDVEVYADPLIEKVIYNLADNAVRYGTTITNVSFKSRLLGDVLELVCEDDGIGIEEDQKERIFERGVGKNTGLGLFLSREILMITGITIRECGEFGKGARFIITFPRGTFRTIERNDCETETKID